MSGKISEQRVGNDIANAMLQLGTVLTLIGAGRGGAVINLPTARDGRLVNHYLKEVARSRGLPDVPALIFDGGAWNQVTVYGIRLRWPAEFSNG